MNALENWFCSSRIWRNMTRRTLLPWLLADVELGEHLLELGAGAGAATTELRQRAPRVTSLEYSAKLAAKLVANNQDRNDSAPADDWTAGIVQGDATRLPFAPNQFSSAIAVLMLHHLPSAEQQDQAFREAWRVLRAGGVFVGFEIYDRWLQRLSHFRSTFVPMPAATAEKRLASAGFADIRVEQRPQGFRFRAAKPR